ncbi:MAG: YSIRK-type signal peptide-containing protein, partial [Finegoldia magna]|nr:YSIRK-type signal peptide-containing protein [Finegoldia magna]
MKGKVMGNREIFNKIITERKTKSSNKKPKYGMRKLTVGVVSCLLGYMMFFTPNVTQAEKVEETPQVASEVVAPLSEINTVDVNNPEVSNKNEEAEVTAKPATEEKVTVAEANQERKQSEDFNAEIKEIEVEKNGIVNYKEAITNLPADASVKPSAEIDTSKTGKHTIAVDINFADGSTTTVNITINVIEKANADKPNDLEIGEKIGSDQSVKATADNIVEPDPDIPFDKTKARVEIVKKGINGGEFPFDEIFAKGSTSVTLTYVDENGDDVEKTATIDASTGEMIFDNIGDMPAVKDGEVWIDFNGENIKGKFIYSYEGPDYGQGGATNITTFKLILNQIRNTDVVVSTKDKSGAEVPNPTTGVTNGKIKKGNTTVDIPTKGDVVEFDDPYDLLPEEVDEFNRTEPEYSIEGTTDNGLLVDQDGNKVYRPGEFIIDKNGLDPTTLEFTEKPLVTTPDDAGKDKDYAKVTFVVGDKGETPSETSMAVIKGVKHGGKISAPADPKGKKGYTFKEWSNGGVQEVYNADTRHEALFDVVAPTGQNIETELNQKPDAKSAISNANDLPDGTTFTWKSEPDVSSTGAKPATVVVTYPDGSSEEVEVPVTVTVKDGRKDNEKYTATATPIQKENGQATTADEVIGAVKTDYPADAEKQPEIKLKDGETLPDGKTEGTHNVTVVVTYPDGTSEEVTVPVIVGKDTRTDAEKNDPEAATSAEGTALETELNVLPKAEDGIGNKDKLTNVKQYVWSQTPDVSKVGNTTGKVLIQYNDGSTDEVEVPVTVVDSRKDNEKNPAVDPAKTEVKDKTKLTEEEKAKVVEEVK